MRRRLSLCSRRKSGLVFFLGILAAGMLFGRIGEAAPPSAASLHAEAIAESLIPIRPGVPGQSPFWNRRAVQFIYAPSFGFQTVPKAQRYRFIARPDGAGQDLTFEATEPWAPLTPIWKDLPVGNVTLRVEALSIDGQVLGEAGKRSFYRAAVFHGPYHQRVTDYRQSARLALECLLNREHIQNWRREGKPDPRYTLYCYPSSTIPAVISGMTAYAKLSPRPARADEALEIARAAARYLIAVSEPAGAPWEFLPPTYAGENYAAKAFKGQIMLVYPVGAAGAYLDLHEATGQPEWLDAAKRIAATYKKRQLPNGTWPLKVYAASGKPIAPNLCLPMSVMRFFDRLADRYHLDEYREASRAAFRYVVENPLKTFNWEGQFEDVSPKAPYLNLSHVAARQAAAYLFDHMAEDPRFRGWAEELVRFAEDQFVIWERPLPRQGSKTWFTPCGLEQYNYYVPICASGAGMVSIFQKAYEATGKQLYLAKACAMADGLTVVQQRAGNGWYPTCLWPPFKSEGWINCGVSDAKVMFGLGTMLAERGLE